jgi:oxygen-independent coproporphyrinogen-3 oxidase
MSTAATPVRSVYVHAPFCARRCPYCDFAVQVRRIGDLDGWLAALSGELRAVEAEGRFPLAPALDTLYVGGGTPSLLGPEAMAGLARLLGPERLRGDAPLEWTAEANPESFTPELAAAWRAAGVNRLSLGVQSFAEPALRWMGRLHGPEGARRAVRAARGAGLRDLSLDLIFALPDEVERDWEADLEALLAIGPPHVSLYGLTVEKGTPLARLVAEGRVHTASEERYREEYLRAAERLVADGYEHYEVSNFALPDHRSRHNRVYWEGGAYLGLGNGAHSFTPPLRRWNVREWDAYAAAASAGRLPLAEEEIVSEESRRLERIWLGLRTDRGLPWAELGDRARARALAERWRASGLAYPQRDESSSPTGGDALRLTPQGWLLLDRLAVEMDEALSDPAGPTTQVYHGSPSAKA